jgi:hypothetical protein
MANIFFMVYLYLHIVKSKHVMDGRKRRGEVVRALAGRSVGGRGKR